MSARAALLLALAAPSCVVPPDLARARKEARAARAASEPDPEERAGLQEFVGAIHVHTYLSHDSAGTEEELVSGARRARLDFVALTDHFTRKILRQPAGLRRKVLFIPGAEISCRGGSVLALGLRKWFPSRGLGWEATARQVETHGAIPFLGHLEHYPLDAGPGRFRGAGVVNLHAVLHEGLEGWGGAAFALSLVGSLLGGGPGLRYLPLVRRPDAVIEAWERLARERPFAAFAESDAHASVRWGPFHLDPYEAVFRLVRTHLLAPALEERPILEALVAGRGFVAFDALADATGFRLRGKAGEAVAFLGETLPLTPDARLEVAVPAAGKVVFYRDGVLVAQVPGPEVVLPVTRPGLWRVEVYLSVWGTDRLWIFSNPIRVVGV
ncbi:MAG TPA: hypothetical protein VFI25_04180 [Planctomycetota bacterium]|nr:hypothetical protein [Planctomycetota bacterium]